MAQYRQIIWFSFWINNHIFVYETLQSLQKQYRKHMTVAETHCYFWTGKNLPRSVFSQTEAPLPSPLKIAWDIKINNTAILDFRSFRALCRTDAREWDCFHRSKVVLEYLKLIFVCQWCFDPVAFLRNWTFASYRNVCKFCNAGTPTFGFGRDAAQESWMPVKSERAASPQKTDIFVTHWVCCCWFCFIGFCLSTDT